MKLDLSPSPEFEKKHIKESSSNRKKPSFISNKDKQSGTKRFWKAFEKVSK